MAQAPQVRRQAAERKGRGSQTSWYQANAMLKWVEIPANFKLITGGAATNQVVAGSKVKKTDAYRDLAHAVNLRLGYSRPSEMWDVNKAKSRFDSQLKKYKDMKRDLNDVTGPKFCLTENELKAGMTIEAKRDKLFPQFQRWDNLFGGRQNISPSFTMEPGVNTSSDSTLSSIHSQDVHGSELVVLPDYEPIDTNEQHLAGAVTAQVTTSADFSSDPALNVEDLGEMDFADEEEQENVVNFKPRGESVRSTLKKKSTNLEVDPALITLAAETAKKAGDTGDPRLSKKSKGDFTSAYTAAKNKEIEILHDTKNRDLDIKQGRLELDRKVAEADLEFRAKKLKVEEERGFMDLAFAKESKAAELAHAKENAEKAQLESTRRELSIALVKEGKTPTEMKEYLATLGF